MYIKSAQLIHTPLDMHSYPGFQETAEATIHAGNIVYVQTGECEARFKNIMLVNSDVVIMLLIMFHLFKCFIIITQVKTIYYTMRSYFIIINTCSEADQMSN